MADDPRLSVAALTELFRCGWARVPASWALDGPEQKGLWWRTSGQEVVGTPLLLRCAAQVVGDGERVGLLLASEPRYRAPWLGIVAARLVELGRGGQTAELCREIDVLGAAASVLKTLVPSAQVAPTPHASVELALFGTPADQPAAAPGLLRVLGQTAPLVEGGQGGSMEALAPVDPRAPSVNWVRGRLLQAPGTEASGGTAVLRGALGPFANPTDSEQRMAWVLETPWVTLMAVIAFTAEAWAAERQGGLELELPGRHVQHFAQPPQVDVVVTLADGQEILCGTLGELCLRALDALGMAVVPTVDASELDHRLSPVIAALLRTGVWSFKPEARTRYVIGEAFGFDCYRGDGHRHIYLGAEDLSQTLRGVAVSWAKERTERAAREVNA